MQQTRGGPCRGWMWSLCARHVWTNMFDMPLLRESSSLPIKRQPFSIRNLQRPALTITHLWPSPPLLWACCAACQRSPTGLHLVQGNPRGIISTELSYLQNNSTFVWMLFDKLSSLLNSPCCNWILDFLTCRPVTVWIGWLASTKYS